MLWAHLAENFCVLSQVGLETEGFAIYDTFMNVRNQVNVRNDRSSLVAVGLCI